MLTILLTTFGIGFTAASLPGAVQTTVFRAGLTGRAKNALMIALGAATMDGILLLIASLGVGQLIAEQHALVMIFGLLGAGFMIYLALSGVRDTWSKKTHKSAESRSSYLSGLLLVALQPPTILYYIGVASGVFRDCDCSLGTYALAASCVSLGAILCFICVFSIARFAAQRGSENVIKWFSTGASIVLLIFAFKLLIEII